MNGQPDTNKIRSVLPTLTVGWQARLRQSIEKWGPAARTKFAIHERRQRATHDPDLCLALAWWSVQESLALCVGGVASRRDIGNALRSATSNKGD